MKTYIARVFFDDMILERRFCDLDKARRWAAYQVALLAPAIWEICDAK